jgi:hypothetical protein
MSSRLKLHCLALLALTCAAHSADAATYTVTNLSDSGSGSLREQIALANISPSPPHQIVFAPALSGGIIELLQPLPTISAGALTIDASAAPGLSVEPINPLNSFRLLTVGSAVQALTLRGFTLSSGRAENTGSGGGCLDGSNVNTLTSRLTLDRMRFRQCVSVYAGFSRGGAVHWNGVSVDIIDSDFIGNGAISNGSVNQSQASGGAVYGSVVNVEGSRFELNQASGRTGFGGAVFALSGVSVSDSVFLDNRADSTVAGGSAGAALMADCSVQCALNFERSSFVRNVAGTGAGLFLRTATNALSVARMDNLSFEGNAASGTSTTAAGAIELFRTLLDARHLSFQSNSGPVSNLTAANSSVVRELYNTVLGRGTGIGCFLTALVQQAQANIAVDTNCGNVIPGALIIPTLANGSIDVNSPMPVIRYAANSPTVDSGNAASCVATDAVGTLRPQDGNDDGNAACDIGAHERLGDRLFRDGFES